MAEDLGRRLREARRAVGLSRKAVAERLGLTVGAVQHHETGRSDPEARTVAAYARMYRQTTDWLLLGRGVGPSGAADPVAEIADILDALPSDQREHALSVIRTFRREKTPRENKT